MLSFLKATSSQETFSNTKCAEVYCQTWEHFSIICTFCELKTFEFDDFLQHFKNVHMENNVPNPEVTIKCETEETANEFDDATEYHEQLQDIQQLTATTEEDFKAFDNKHFNESVEHNGISSSSNSDVDNDESHDDDEYAPAMILKGPQKKVLPVIHKCSECPKAYKLAKFLEHHINKYHNTNKIFKCTQCKSEFSDERTLNSHAQSVHKGFSCDQCSKKYKNKQDLQNHAFIHTGQRNFICDIENCGKTFYSPSHLRCHKRIVHTMERNYICELCGYRTKQKLALVVHKRSHTGEKPFACKQCDRRFGSQALLVEHMAMHSSERPHKCEVCGATFARPKALYHHKHLHLGIKKFVCKICGKAYAQAAGLAGHVRQHKSEKF